MCDHRYRVGRWVHPGTWTNDPKAMAWDVGHPGDFGYVTPGTGSGREESPWGLWTCDPKCSVWEKVDPGDCDPMYMGLGVTLDTADIRIQVQCLGGVSPLRMWPCDQYSGWGE